MWPTAAALRGHGARVTAMAMSSIESTSSIRKPMNVNGSANGAPIFMPMKPVLQRTTNNPGVLATNAGCIDAVVAGRGDNLGGDIWNERSIRGTKRKMHYHFTL